MKTILPGGVIGIIGGGQLGRMASLAASGMGYKTHIYCPDKNCPASQVSTEFTCAPYDDLDSLKEFAEEVDVISFEFENIPTKTVKFLERIVEVRPSSKVLYIAQNRLREKKFFNEVGAPTNRCFKISDAGDIKTAFKKIAADKAVMKTSELGYDGKGQIIIEKNSDFDLVWKKLGEKEAILEEFIGFKKEISVIIARNIEGEIAIYPVSENVHTGGILDKTTVPADISKKTADAAKTAALKIAEGLGLTGLIAVEFFVTGDGGVLVNEIAPRPHNSGHWTMDGCVTSQFEQFIRAVSGLPLGSTLQHSSVKMKNLIGKDMDDLRAILKDPNAKLHLYGKKEARNGRKMGHVNYISPLK